MSIDDMVAQGHRILAGRLADVIVEYRCVSTKLDGLMLLHEAEENLRCVSMGSAEIDTDVLRETVRTIRQQVSPIVKSPQQTGRVVLDAIREHHSYDMKTFRKEAGFREYTYHPKTSGIVSLGEKNVLFLVYTPQNHCYTICSNVLLVERAIISEYKHFREIFGQLHRFEHIDELFKTISDQYRDSYAAFVRQFHNLHFFDHPVMRKHIRDSQMVDSEVDDFLRLQIPQADFLQTIGEGRACLNTVEVVGHADVFDARSVQLALMVSTLHYMIGPADVGPMSHYRFNGVGLLAYDQEHPGTLVNVDESFKKELSGKYATLAAEKLGQL